MFKQPSIFKKAQQYTDSVKRKNSEYQSTQTNCLDEIQDKPIHVIDKYNMPSMQIVKPLSANNQRYSVKGVGVFADTKRYSDFIRSSLQILEVNIFSCFFI